MYKRKIDYKSIGLKVGLEVHRQLDTKHKLFCNCPTTLSSKKADYTFERKLRPSQSEVGEIDPAALFEWKKRKTIIYEGFNDITCLVEADEEPPHSLNKEALEIALTVSLMMNSTPVDEIHVMRKIVIDGSNTSGFQRTCIVALGGEIEVNGKKVPIQHVGLEEDAARKIEETGNYVRYRLDRLGIPLIEVATAPVINSPEETEKVAFAIGRILKATKKVKRGIGTVRQDINISIREGALIEVKGVQELPLVRKVVEYEVLRQLNLLKIRDELKSRGLKKEEIKSEIIDVSDAFKKTKCKVIRRALNSGGRVFAVKLPKFSGILGMEIMPGFRFGTELSDIAKLWGGVGGIFHTDELPAYGISLEEVEKVKSLVKAEKEDAFVLVADKPKKAVEALKAVIERAKKALEGVPSETRVAKPDGTTRYMRPRPGAARMYPETDIPPIRISKEYIENLKTKLPEMPDKTLKRLMKEYGLNEKLASQLLDSEYLLLFEEIVRNTSISPSFVAATLTESFKSLKHEGINIDLLSDKQIYEIFKFVDSGKMAKEAILDVVQWLSNNPDKGIEDALKALGLTMLSKEELEEIIDDIISQSHEMIKERKLNALKPLMSMVMRKVRGKANPKEVYEILDRKLKEITKS